MLASPKKFFHVVEAVLTIAQHVGSQPISSKDIAVRQELTPRYLEQMLQKLVKAGILRGLRGPRGGYVLAREKRRITLADVYAVIRESDLPVEPQPDSLGAIVVAPVWRDLQAQTETQLATITLADLAQRCPRLPLKGMDKNVDFTI